jgi:uncharacterized protein GlcG (DUF336 family)
MPDALTLDRAQAIVAACMAAGRRESLLPLAVVVLDARGMVKALGAEDGIALGRPDLAIGKANAALQMGMGTRALAKRAKDLPVFFASIGQSVRGGFIPNPGGVLIRDAGGLVIGAVGISGDTGGRDEEAAVAGISAAGFIADPGED